MEGSQDGNCISIETGELFEKGFCCSFIIKTSKDRLEIPLEKFIQLISILSQR